ncbi:MAG: ester cyclase [Shimia sp.]|jgi:predicted ester cyclase|uniref:ester cyclase n=1 Tax=Shimia sp. TaxID=1954381 RepID=UPI004058A25D
MNKKSILTNWYQRVWVECDLTAIDEYLAPDTEAEGLLPEFSVDSKDFRALVPMCLALVENLEVNVDKVLEDGDWAAALISMQAISPTTGQPVMITGQLFARFKDDMIVEAYNGLDTMSFFTQLGLLPEQSLEFCLSGQKIA